LSITRGQSLDAARVHVPGASVGGGAFVDEFAFVFVFVFGEGGDDTGEHPPGWGCSSRCLPVGSAHPGGGEGLNLDPPANWSVMIVSYRDADLVLGRGCAAGLACR